MISTGTYAEWAITYYDKCRNASDDGGAVWLNGCASLTSLPDSMAVGKDPHLEGCVSLTGLSENLAASEDIYLPKNLHEKVKKDAAHDFAVAVLVYTKSIQLYKKGIQTF